MAALNIQEFTYPLPQERIALYPLAERDQSRLLVYQQGSIRHTRFHTLADHLPPHSFLIFNNTRVIPARLHFAKDTGATIEIFLLHPIAPSPLLVDVMNAKGTCLWKCTIGNQKRWKTETRLTMALNELTLQATLVDREAGIVQFHWPEQWTFAEVIQRSGETPLPPYLKRKPEHEDKTRYQTVYSKHEGAVAAPTAGLHFTPGVFDSLQAKNIASDFVTLHVSAGTFQPIKVDDASRHIMHEEQIVITRSNVENLLDLNRFFVAVGTTSVRTLESVYWYGARLLRDKASTFTIHQDDPYTIESPPSRTEAIEAVLDYMRRNGLETLTGETSIFIRPGYKFRICQGIITNFHQPASTLILLVAAFIGSDWKTVYDEALKYDYRFLSYGDSSLLLP